MSDISPGPLKRPVASVVVVNYNSGVHLSDCVTALLQAEPTLPFEIFVVDNASEDDSLVAADAFAAQHDHIKVLRSPINRGYAGGVNLALAGARGAYVAVLNPDMVVAPGWLTHLVTFLETHPNAGALNPLIVLSADNARINAAGQDVHVTGLGFNRWLGRPRARAGSEPMRVSGLQGGALVIRRALLEQMGGWDDSGFLYHEDVELSWMLRLMGYELYCLPTATVQHDYHLTMYPEKLFLLERNRAAMLLTNLETRSLCLLAPLLFSTECLMWGYCLLRGWDFVKAKAASYAWVVSQRERLRARKAFVLSLRRRTDWQVLRGLCWVYAWDQLLTLGRERGTSRRVPAGGLPVNLSQAHE
jgi:GT2 family glycosyltransferase